MAMVLLLFPRFLLFLSTSADYSETSLSPLERFLSLHFSLFLFAVSITLVLYVSSIGICIDLINQIQQLPSRYLPKTPSRHILPEGVETLLDTLSLARSRVHPFCPRLYPTTQNLSARYLLSSSFLRVSSVPGASGWSVQLFLSPEKTNSKIHIHIHIG